MKLPLITIATFLLISLLHVSFVSSSGGFLFSSDGYYGLGYPAPWLVWTIDSQLQFLGVDTITTDWNQNIISHQVSLPKVLSTNDGSVSFSREQSLVGFLIDLVFWSIAAFFLYNTWRSVKSRYGSKFLLIFCFVIFVLVLLTFFLSSVDLSNDTVTGRGAPFEYLKRLQGELGIYGNYYFLPFIFILDMLIIWQVIGIILILARFNKKLKGEIKLKPQFRAYDHIPTNSRELSNPAD